jgi:pullulanase/glycogen debranching enzyme
MPDTSSLASFGVERGWPQPLGASPVPGGVNFSLFSLNDTGVELPLFATHDAPEPFRQYGSIHRSTRASTSGTYSHAGSRLERTMPIALMGHPMLPPVTGSTQIRC